MFKMLQAHHILLQELARHFTLKVLGDRFQLNGIKNLMHLPSDQRAAQELGSSPHTGGHLASYKKIFCKFLNELQEHPSFAAAQEGNTAALDQLDAELTGFLAAAKYALARGHLLTNTPSGMTQEEANKRIQDWYENWRTYAKDNRNDIQQMQDTINQFLAAGRGDAALSFPLLSPTSGLSVAERIEILKRLPQGSPISLQFTNVGPVPDLPGLVPPTVNTRLPGFIPPSLEGLNQPEGFTPSNPLLTYGLPGFPAINPQGFGQLPPTIAVSEDPLVLKFDPATGWPLPFSERSPILDPDPPSEARPPAALYMGAGLAGAAALAPEFLPLWARMAVAGIAASAPTLATARNGVGGVFSTGALPYDPFNPDQKNSYIGGPGGGPWANEGTDQKTIAAPPTVNHRGNQDETSDPARQSQVIQSEGSRSAASVTPEDVRRLARVNESNAGSVFSSGGAPVPYLPPADFNERFGSWAMPTAPSGQPQSSRPIGVFADEPSYLISPPIFGVDGSRNSSNDAEEWFSRWIRPLLPPQ